MNTNVRRQESEVRSVNGAACLLVNREVMIAMNRQYQGARIREVRTGRRLSFSWLLVFLALLGLAGSARAQTEAIGVHD